MGPRAYQGNPAMSFAQGQRPEEPDVTRVTDSAVARLRSCGRLPWNRPAMTKHYRDITRSISASLAKLRPAIPDVTHAFGLLAKAATKDGALDKKTKELIALASGSPRTATAASASTSPRWSSSAPRAPRSRRRSAWRSTWAAARR